MTDVYFMEQAWHLAQEAKSEGEVPVGAVLVNHKGQVMGKGYNLVINNHDPSAHAEIITLREAGKLIKNHRLLNTTLYVTLEPCSMCMAALVHARVQRLVFATRDFKTGAAGSVYNLAKGYSLNHTIKVDEGVMQKKCALLMNNFFLKKRLS